MAAPTDPTSIPPANVAPRKLPSNPTPLSAPQEQQVRDLYYKNVRAKCADEIKGVIFSSVAMLSRWWVNLG